MIPHTHFIAGQPNQEPAQPGQMLGDGGSAPLRGENWVAAAALRPLRLREHSRSERFYAAETPHSQIGTRRRNLSCTRGDLKVTKKLAKAPHCVIFAACEDSLFDMKRGRRETSCPSPQEKPRGYDGI
jgi:hypothetical protein